jgi:hypothetical protein
MTAAPMPWAANPFLSTEFMLTVGLLMTALLAGAVVLFFLDRWRKRQLADSNDSAESLTSFRAMYERGELTESEYRVVRDKMARKVRQEVAVSNPSTAAQPPPDPAASGGREDSADGAAPNPPEPPSG